MNGNFID